MAVPHDSILGGLHADRRRPRLHREMVQQESRAHRVARTQMVRAMREHRRAIVSARAEARRGGRQLLRILDNLPRPD